MGNRHTYDNSWTIIERKQNVTHARACPNERQREKKDLEQKITGSHN